MELLHHWVWQGCYVTLTNIFIVLREACRVESLWVTLLQGCFSTLWYSPTCLTHDINTPLTLKGYSPCYSYLTLGVDTLASH